MKLLETFVYISAKDEAMKAGLKTASKYAKSEVREMQRVFDSLKFNLPNFKTLVAGAAGLYGVKATIDQLIGSTVKAGSAFNDMSARTGVAVETLSGLGYIAKQTGTDVDAVEKSVKYLTNQMLDASRGTGSALKTFRELNISVTDSKGALRPTIDVMMDAADVIGKMTNETAQAAYAADLFGARTGTMLLPMLKEGSVGMRAMMEEAKRLGIIMSTEDAAAADAAGDAMDTFTAALEGVKRSIAIGVLPAMTDFIKATTELLASNRELIKVTVSDWLDKIGAGMAFLWGHRETIKTVFQAAAIVLIATKLYYLAKAIGAVTVALSALGTSAGLTALMGASGPIGVLVGVLTGLSLLLMDLMDKAPSIGRYNEKVAFRDRRLKGASVDTRTLGYDITAGTGLGAASLYDFESFYAANNRTGAANRSGGGGAGTGGAGLWRMQMNTNLLGLSRFTNTGMLGAGGQFTPGADFGAFKADWWKQFTPQEGADEWFKEWIADEYEYMVEWIDKQIEIYGQGKAAALEFSQYWGSVMAGMWQQADGSFRRILDSFQRMIESMMVEATFVGLLNMFTGGTGGFMGGFKSVFSRMIPGKAAGGPVSAGSPYLVGERGPELFVPRQSGKIIPNGAMTDNSQIIINFSGNATRDGAAEVAAQLDRIIRERKSRELERLRRGVA